jgi:hypothetical protein
MADTLYSDQWLRPGEYLQSANKYHVFIMQTDGNLVLYSLGKPTWNSGTVGRTVDGVIMQSDGNLVIYAPGNTAVWNVGAHPHGQYRLVMQDDGNAVVYNSNNHATWNSGTATDPELWETRQVEISPELMTAMKNDPDMAPYVMVGLVCTGGAIIYCVAAVIVIALILEFTHGKPPFGPNNDFRVIGGQISDGAKQAGKNLASWSKGKGDSISKTIKKWL